MAKIPFEQNQFTELTESQIAGFKKEYGDVFCITVGDKSVYLHKPTRQIIDLAQLSSKTRPSLFEETIIKNCWLAGDKSVLDDANVEEFYAVAAQVGGLVAAKEAEIKKL